MINHHDAVITELSAIAAYLEGAEAVAFDFETAPKEAHRFRAKAALDPHLAKIVGISLSKLPYSPTYRAIYIPIDHKKGINAPARLVLSLLKTLLFENPQVLKIAHNLAFEAKFLLARGISLTLPVYDTMAAAQLMYQDPVGFRGLGFAGLKTMVRDCLGVQLPSYQQTVGEQAFDAFDPTDPTICTYACCDAYYTLKLHGFLTRWFEKNIPEHGTLTRELESPVALFTAMMEYNGVMADGELLDSQSQEAARQLDAVRKNLETGGSRPVRVGENAATHDLKTYLFSDAGLPVLKRTDKGNPSVDNEALDALMDYCRTHGLSHLDYLNQVKAYRSLQKLSKTYLAGLLTKIHPVTGAIHSRFFPLGTETGRFSSQHPNCQNLPAGAAFGINIRDLIKARPGHTLVAADYSQIELRIGAWLTGDTAMLTVYQEGGDIHGLTTAAVYGIDLAEALDQNQPLYKERRTVAKNINFGIFYGLYPRGLQKILKLKAGLSLPLDQCEGMIERIHRAYPGLKLWQERIIRVAQSREIMATPLGRQRCLPGINDADEMIASHRRRGALNHPIQGCAADILKLSMVRLLPFLTENPAIRPLLTVHDELVFEVADGVLDNAIKDIKTIMEATPFPGFTVPLAVSMATGMRYGSLRPYDERGAAETQPART